ncbi:phosphatidic acid phosphatase type 2 domain-containing protein 1A [Coprinopsis cinerea okayama7|uniref:Phosphatidic acid phosphatase type 2 domain-containing protein 1A n=1 Tax=Coprinopsis cinerea (strain Okayama-7 / 130 / ATCC MYA-4618 / FGSC 9003) TaxID=240176 RepID=A8NH35_COPC7|nr:phosphatidic acid phosphatase type 2 domain-containing protein 1A [Coprinopsis cinerea okayama7\|eukprot:XP_001833670.2 phosphatidic acid phosphatase type 2 domain-containing protein 1A [Coprinopsis cinerea okayama7\
MHATQGKIAGWFPVMYPIKHKKMTPARRRKLLLSYAPDWAITLLLAAAFYALDKVTGYRRQFSLDDSSLRYPHALHERVPNGPLYFIVFGIPIILMPLINFFTVRSWWDLHNSSLGLVLGLALTGATTQFIKITVGRPRPDIIDRCIPPPGATNSEFGLFDWTQCTQADDSLLNEGFRSFPSGHSSMSFAGLGFLAFYLAGKLHLFDTRGHAGKAWAALFPFCGAAMVAISRTMDYRHHWQDVIVGSAMGIIFSYFAYRQYYPPLDSEVAHRPYSPRIKDSDSHILPTHMSTANTTAYNPNPSFPPSNRYNNSPSPPPNPFLASNDGSGMANAGGYDTVRLGVDGTVPRPGPGSMEEVWKEGASSGFDGTVPRSRGTPSTDESSEGHSTAPLTAREQQQRQFLQQQPRSTSPQRQDEYSIPLRTPTQQSHPPQQPPQRYATQDAYDGIQ